MGPIDSAMFGIEEQYLVPMLIATIVASFLAAYFLRAWKHEKAADSKVASGKIETTNDLPYDKRYDAMTLLSFLAGAALGLWMTPAIVNACFINAGMGTYVGTTILASAAATVLFMYLTHCGIRLTLVRAKEYAFGVIDAVQETVTDVRDKLDDGKLNGSVSGGTEVTDAIVGAITRKKEE